MTEFFCAPNSAMNVLEKTDIPSIYWIHLEQNQGRDMIEISAEMPSGTMTTNKHREEWIFQLISSVSFTIFHQHTLWFFKKLVLWLHQIQYGMAPSDPSAKSPRFGSKITQFLMLQPLTLATCHEGRAIGGPVVQPGSKARSSSPGGFLGLAFLKVWGSLIDLIYVYYIICILLYIILLYVYCNCIL